MSGKNHVTHAWFMPHMDESLDTWMRENTYAERNRGTNALYSTNQERSRGGNHGRCFFAQYHCQISKSGNPSINALYYTNWQRSNHGRWFFAQYHCQINTSGWVMSRMNATCDVQINYVEHEANHGRWPFAQMLDRDGDIEREWQWESGRVGERQRETSGGMWRERERETERKRERNIARKRDKTRESGSEDERARARAWAREPEREVGRVGLNRVYMIAGIIGRAQMGYPKVFKGHSINFSRCYRLRMESHFVLDLTRSHLWQSSPKNAGTTREWLVDQNSGAHADLRLGHGIGR